jgi:hypothetical protein
MTHSTTFPAQAESFVTEMTDRMTHIAQELSTWVTAEPRTLAEIEKRTLAVMKDVNAALAMGLCNLAVPHYPEDTIPCSCGQTANYQRMRPAHVDTLLGTITITRPYYLCPSCHHGQAPLDDQMGFCAGGISAGLDETLALMGSRAPFEEATDVLQRLTLVNISPNSCKTATETLGQTIAAQENKTVSDAWNSKKCILPPLPETIPERLYVSMDGTMVHTHEDGWKEMRLGAVYTTTAAPSKKRPDQLDIRARDASYFADFADPASFGRGLWAEAYRRGVSQTKEVVAIGDGAHWIWDQVHEHFPQAIEIVDWYHATSYIWTIAHALHGEGTDAAKAWARSPLDDLWDGKTDAVLAHLQGYVNHSAAGEAARSAITYYTNNKERMNYPVYRAKNIQIGSGCIESSCEHVLGSRLKQAGMIWNVEGARAVAKVRTRLKSGRWDETIASRPPPQRDAYTRKTA